ncbi:MAG: hypothetical protein J6866_07305 [Victivallales bacterium]|nr:hypothetical protein [Victivallales bacterium]
MTIQPAVSDILLFYLLLLLLGTALFYVFDRLQDHNRDWKISRARLMTCRKCGQVFLLRRQSQNRKCPECGGNSGEFRYPRSEIQQDFR